MASESDVPALIQRLMLMPLFASISTTRSEPHPEPDPDRIVLINPLTQAMVVIGRNGNGVDFDSLFKDGQPPASKASIDGLPVTEIKCCDDVGKMGSECVICLEEFGIGDLVSEMPCKHKFHGGCVKKWLRMHGSCPVCRYKMPVAEDDDDLEKKIGDESGGRSRRRREIWVTFAFGDGRLRNEGEVEFE
ncbi:hypothetical protein QVD17_31718 [Tagetes erecta]|uniref:RING-type E3 ubiquitin transferase n=1 Tax=Tagetes erecta TaxID=13708 RepID=A0AAD8KAF1_TARER|nr:hypothetical protein QVD17_31718 [Tagetes erecta]